MTNSNRKAVMLTTFDNPFNPFKDFDNWYLFDIEKGYDSCSRLARVTKTNDAMTEDEYNAEVARAIDVIITNDILNVFTRVYDTK